VAIQLYCQECKSYVPVASKKCPKCGTAFSRDNKKFRVDVTSKGRRVTRFVPNLTIARELEASLKADLLRDEFDITAHKAKKSVTLNDIWQKFAPWAQEHLKCWRTDEGFYRKHIEPRFGTKPLDAISPLDLERMKTELRKGSNAEGRSYAAQTVKHQLNLVSRLFNRAIQWGMYSGGNPVKQVRPVRVDNQVTAFLDDEEVDRLLKVLNEWPCRESAAFVRLALLSGLRRGEIIKLRWDDLDFDRSMVRLREPKGGPSQTIPLSAEAMDVLRDLDVTGGELVFPGKTGGERYDFKGPWKRIREAAQLPTGFRFHDLRHNFASHLVSSGVPLHVVQGLLTHKDSRTTARYAHLSPGVLQQAAAKSGELLTGKKRDVVLEMKK
jgi:integrase